MSAKRIPYSFWLHEVMDVLIEQLRIEENLGWHHLPGGDIRFQTYLRTSTWIQEIEEKIERWNKATTEE